MGMGAGRRLNSLALIASMASLAACGGGGGGSAPGVPAPAATFGVSGTVSGMSGGTLVLSSNGADVNVTANGSTVLATGLPTGTAYAVSVKTNPSGYSCTVANGSGTIAAANVSNVEVTCAQFVLNLASPADDTLVPLGGAQEISATIGGTTAARLTWTILPAGIAANATLTPVSSTSTTVVMSFSATMPGDYTVRVTSQDDSTKVDEVRVDVHQVYTQISGKSQRRAYLQADGHIRSDIAGTPTGLARDIATGYRYGVAAMTDGTVTTWGDPIPAPVPSGLTNVTAVAAGSYFAMAQKDDGTLTVWGHLNNDAVMAPEVAGIKVVDFDTTLGTLAVIKEDGSMLAWEGDSGNLRPLPAEHQARKFTKFCATQWHIVAIDDAGAVHAWNPTNTSDPALGTPPATTGLVTDVYCGSDQAALVQADGRVMTWGEELGDAGAFDSSAVSGFPRIKDAAFYSYGDPRFLTEGGAVIDRDGALIRSVDDL